MKKFISLLLTLAMLLSLAVPAMAAEGDTYYISGSFSGWGAFEPMTWNAAQNRYEYVLTNVAATNTGAYQVSSTPDWQGTRYNDSGVVDDSNNTNAQYTVAEDGSTVTLCFDGTKTFAIVTAPGEEAAAPTITGGDKAAVKATYTPVITISDIILSATYNDGCVTVDEANKTYFVTIPSGAEPEASVTATVKGTNLDKASEYGEIRVSIAGSQYDVIGPYVQNGEYQWNMLLTPNDIGLTDLQCSFDTGVSWTNTGWKVNVRQGYAVTFSDMISNGTVTAGKAFAAEGDTVTLTVTPDEGYELDDVVVTYRDADGNWKYVPVTDNTFVMPAAEVIVNAYFGEFTGPYTVTVDNNIEGGTIAVGSETYTAGERVIVNVYPNEGYVLDKVIATVASTGESLTVTNTAFVMPAANVNVTATFKKGYRIEVTFPDGGETVDFPRTAEEGETVTVKFTAMEGWELQLIEVFNKTDGQLVSHEMVDDNTFTFLMPAGKVAIQFYFWKIGTDLKTIYYKGPWTNMQVYFKNEGYSVSDVIGVPTIEEAGIYAITNIPEHTSKLAIMNAETDEWIVIEPIPTDGRNMYNAVTGEWELYTPSTPEVTSATISWGSLAFTYSDEQVTLPDGTTGDKGWSTDGSDKAGTVTVENTGTAAITASAAYTPATGYAEIEGTLGDAKTLAAGEETTFTLTLTGKPGKALHGEKIGTITVTIK